MFSFPVCMTSFSLADRQGLEKTLWGVLTVVKKDFSQGSGSPLLSRNAGSVMCKKATALFVVLSWMVAPQPTCFSAYIDQRILG